MNNVKDLIINVAICYVAIKAIEYYGHLKYKDGYKDGQKDKEKEMKKKEKKDE